MIVYTHTVPAGTTRDLFTLTINGRRAPFRLYSRQLPHDAVTIAANVFAYMHGVTPERCDALLCDETSTVGIYGGALCEDHASQYTETGRW